MEDLDGEVGLVLGEPLDGLGEVLFSLFLWIRREEAALLVRQGLLAGALGMNEEREAAFQIRGDSFSLHPVLDQLGLFSSAVNLLDVDQHHKEGRPVAVVDGDVCKLRRVVVVLEDGTDDAIIAANLGGEVVAKDGEDKILRVVGIVDCDDGKIDALGRGENFEKFEFLDGSLLIFTTYVVII